MFDAAEGTLPGGNATAFDWTILSGRTVPLPWLLAGGLTPDNVAEAVRVTGAPGVDVSSGVESSRGVKSAELIGAFLDRVKALCRGTRHEDRTAAEGARHRAHQADLADGELRQRGAHRQPALPRRQGAGPAGASAADRQGRARVHARAGLRVRPPDRAQPDRRHEGRAGRPRPGQADRQGAGHGQCHARFRRAAGGDQRLLRPVRRGVRRSRPPRALGGRHGLAAARHPGRDRGDRRGRTPPGARQRRGRRGARRP